MIANATHLDRGTPSLSLHSQVVTDDMGSGLSLSPGPHCTRILPRMLPSAGRPPRRRAASSLAVAPPANCTLVLARIRIQN